MHIKSPSWQNVWNPNTIVTVAGFCLLLAGYAWRDGGQTEAVNRQLSSLAESISTVKDTSATKGDINALRAELVVLSRDFTSYTAAHAEVHKDASALRTGEISRLNTQIEALNTQNLPFRVGSLEAQYANTMKNMDDIKNQMNLLASDQRLTNQKLDQLISIMRGDSPLTPRNQ